MGVRDESLERPGSAAKVPLLFILTVLLLVALWIALGQTRWWLLVLFTPVLLLTAYILARVVATLVPSKKRG